jgi:hypothetical protein
VGHRERLSRGPAEAEFGLRDHIRELLQGSGAHADGHVRPRRRRDARSLHRAFGARRQAGPYKGSYFRLTRVNPTFAADGSDKLPKDIATPYVLYRDVFSGACVNKNGFDYLEISLTMPKGDPRVPPPYHNAAIEGRGFGLHLMDYNLALEDLIQAVSLQAQAALH